MGPVPGTALRTRRGASERVLAWLFTGPLGHLYSVVADLLVYGAGALREQAGRRVRRALSR